MRIDTFVVPATSEIAAGLKREKIDGQTLEEVFLAAGAKLGPPSCAACLGGPSDTLGRLSVPSPKTEHLGKTHRVIPLFPLLRPHLEAAFEQAAEGSTYVFPEEYRRRVQGPYGWANANLRTTLAKVIRRAEVEPWPRPWHPLRASCESDLAQSFPLATVTKWLGNTPSVALRHNVDPTEAAFDQALEWRPTGGAKSGAAGDGRERQGIANVARSS